MMPEHRLALSGIAFAVLLLAAFMLAGGDAPEFAASDREWVRWAVDTESANRIAVLLILLATLAFLVFAGTLRPALGDGPVATSAIAGGVVGIVGIVTAIVLVAAGSLHAGDSDATVTRAVLQAATPGYLLASAGFAGLLGASGVLTLRGAVLARWTGVLALAGAGALLLTFLTVLDPDSEESAFGVGYPLGILCLVVWSIATGIRLSGSAAVTPAPPLPSTR